MRKRSAPPSRNCSTRSRRAMRYLLQIYCVFYCQYVRHSILLSGKSRERGWIFFLCALLVCRTRNCGRFAALYPRIGFCGGRRRAEARVFARRGKSQEGFEKIFRRARRPVRKRQVYRGKAFGERLAYTLFGYGRNVPRVRAESDRNGMSVRRTVRPCACGKDRPENRL